VSADSIHDIAVFDFDGTITRTDTFHDLLMWKFGGRRVLVAMLSASPLILLYLLRLVRNDLPKEFLFRWFFRGYTEQEFNELCRSYALARIDRIVRQQAIEKIQWHMHLGHHIVINTASIMNWIQPWAREHGITHVLATEVEVKNGLLTGHFSTPCCYGEEKLVRLRTIYPDGTYVKLYAYGDSSGDTALLAAADYPSFKAFRD